MSFIDSVKNALTGKKQKGAYIPPNITRERRVASEKMAKIEKDQKDKKRQKMLASMNHNQKQEFFRAERRRESQKTKELEAKKVPSPLTARECPVCQKPMMVAVGQLQFSHKECKPVYKKAVRRAIARKNALANA